MANLSLGEILIDAALVKLRAGMAARITTINAEKTDFSLGTPASNDFYAYGSHLISRVPAVIVTHMGETEMGEEGPHSLALDWSLGVAVVDQDPDRSILGRKLDRLHRAVMETLWDDAPKERLAHPDGGANPDAAYSLKPERFIPGRVADIRESESEPSLFRSFHVQTFRCWRVEEG